MITPRIASVWPRSLVAGALLVCGCQAAKADFALKPNDRVVFYGDSITEQRLYTTFAETYVVTRFPKLPVSFVHSGWGGDTAFGSGGGPIDLRVQRDVLAYRPTVMTVMLGMNDGGYRAFDQERYDMYTTGYKHILDSVKQADPAVRFTLIQASPYDDVTRQPGFPGGYNATLQRFGAFVKDTAAQRGAIDADFNAPVVAMLQKANATNADLSQKIIPDRVHPGPAGHLIMAEALLKAWGAPSVVSDVSIDAATNKVARAQNTQVTDVKSGPTLSWTQLDSALPFPLDTNNPEMALALKSSDFVESLDREPLQVTGLTAPNYTLLIDGDEVGDFSREQLAQGVNLALAATPMRDQAQNVHRLTIKHNDLHFWRWRSFQVPITQEHGPAAKAALPALLKALDDEEAQMVVEQRATAQPKPHRFELKVAAPQPIGANLALHKPYTASDPNVYGYGIGALTDGEWGGDGHTFATGDKDVFPKTVTIDLQQPASISQVRVGLPSFGSTKTVNVSVSTDGEKFTEVGSYVYPMAIDRRHAFAFAPVNARYVRLTYPDHYDQEAGFSKMFSFTNEVEVYGAAP